jgi:signal transduction histidine kinase
MACLSVAAMWPWVCLLLLALLTTNVRAEQRVLDASFFIDPTHSMTLQEVSQQPLRTLPSFKIRMALRSTIWVRLNVAPSSESPNRYNASRIHLANEYIRFVTMYLSQAQVFDPLRADNGDGTDMHVPVQVGLVHRALNLEIPAAPVGRVVWVRMHANGPLVISTTMLSGEELDTLEVHTVLFHGLFLGLLMALLVLALFGWFYDRSVLATALTLKQAGNLLVAALNLQWPEHIAQMTQAAVEGNLLLLRYLNPILSFWFFMCVANEFNLPRWIRTVQKVFMGLLFLNLLLYLTGQAAAARVLHLGNFLLGFPLAVLAGAFCSDAVGLVRSRRSRFILMMRGIGFALLFAMAWFSSYPIGFYRVVATGPAIALGGGIISSVLLLYIILTDRRQKAVVQHTQRQYQDRMAAAALQFERDERVRQQEFMVMLTHELKAPLSAVGMVLHSAQVSASMRQHADKALAAMKRVIDHCAKSIRLDDAAVPLSLKTCSLPVELQLRIDALTPADQSRIRPQFEPDLPQLHTDVEALSVVLSNLLDNALKYSPPDTPILVSVRTETGASGHVQVLSVTNQSLPGPLPRAELMFGKYYRGEGASRVSGSGLGLYLSRSLAHRMGGGLSFEGQDQTVCLTLTLPQPS